MTDASRSGNRTAAGREAALDDHESRLEKLEAWKQLAEYKAGARDRRAQVAVRWAASLSIGVILAVVSAFLAAGGHL
jgi:hypothetical protein